MTYENFPSTQLSPSAEQNFALKGDAHDDGPALSQLASADMFRAILSGEASDDSPQ